VRTREHGAAAAVAAAVLLAAAPAHAIDADQQRERLLFESNSMEERIARQGLLYVDPALDAYLQSVVERLFPGQAGALRVRVIKDPELNAFALASGAIYVTNGALLRIRSEAELAAILGHEGTHVVKEHGLQEATNAKTIAAAGLILSAGIVSLIGFDPLIGQAAAVSSMAGYSRAKEREADEIGTERMVAAGYDPLAAATFFDRARRESKARDQKEGFYPFVSHPRFEERAEHALPKPGASPGESRREEYQAATMGVRAAVLEELRTQRKATALIFLLGDDGMAADNPPAGLYMLGEGYRLRGKEGDADRAAGEYQKSVEAFPDYAPAWGALGRYRARRGERDAAIQCLERFLQLAPDSRDAPFARQALTKLKESPQT
jgi:beta-barrel assembly-enhancing protease